MVFKGNVYSGNYSLHYLKFSPFSGFCINDIPGDSGGVSFLKESVINLIALIIMFVFPRIEGVNLPCGILVFSECLEALCLLLVTYVKEEFQHQVSVISE